MRDRDRQQLGLGPGAAGAAEPTESVDGTVERVVYADEESGWTVLRVSVEGRAEPLTAVGALTTVQPGESVRLRGQWVVDRRWGEQFRVASFQTVKPATLAGIERYLGSGLIRGLGRRIAGRLVEKFGTGTLDVIENAPERLREVAGIGSVRSRRIRDAWAEQKSVQEVMLFLQTHGVSPSWAVRIHRRYGERAVAIVRDDPYRLALEVNGIGFRMADQIAAQLGLPLAAPRRAQAAVLHLLDQRAGEGHCYTPRATLVDQTAQLLAQPPLGQARSQAGAEAGQGTAPSSTIAEGAGSYGALVDGAIDQLARMGRLVVEPLAPAGMEGTEGPRDEAIYATALHLAERVTAEKLRLLASAPSRALDLDVTRALAWFEETARIGLAPAQRAAVERALSAKVLVITGGPGTGKTTIVRAVLRILERKGRRILLAAPTGRAAKRLAEATGREAKTIHRLLEYAPARRGEGGASKPAGFQRTAEKPLDCDLLVVDEASMIDQPLAAHLVAAVPHQAQLVFVGDVDQLPSVGPGSVLRELIQSGSVEVVRLTEIFRQARESYIVTNAHRIHRGELPVAPTGDANADFFLIEREQPEDIAATVKELVATRIPRRFGLDPIADVQVLTPMVRGLLGARELNDALQALLNPPSEAKAQLVRGGRTYRVGDKLMQVRNNYDLDVFNGDVGRLTALDEEERQLMLRLDERDVAYDLSDADELQLAYACTIHKSQGSEYPAVVIPLHTQHFVLLERNLLYTAVTRGKRLVVVVGSRRALKLAVENERLVERATRLAERLRGALR